MNVTCQRRVLPVPGEGEPTVAHEMLQSSGALNCTESGGPRHIACYQEMPWNPLQVVSTNAGAGVTPARAVLVAVSKRNPVSAN